MFGFATDVAFNPYMQGRSMGYAPPVRGQQFGGMQPFLGFGGPLSQMGVPGFQTQLSPLMTMSPLNQLTPGESVTSGGTTGSGTTGAPAEQPLDQAQSSYQPYPTVSSTLPYQDVWRQDDYLQRIGKPTPWTQGPNWTPTPEALVPAMPRGGGRWVDRGNGSGYWLSNSGRAV
jgi:hypothetical protein